METNTGEQLTVTASTAVIGAEISGVDLRNPMTRQLRDALHRLLCRYRVLFFRDQHLSTQQHITFAETFGPILIFPNTAPNDDPRYPGVRDVNGSTVGWHLDASGQIEPPVATVLSAVEIPATGGDTIWADGLAAYNGLPAELKKRLQGLCAIHTDPDRRPIVAHPLAPIHRYTGQRYLFINLASWIDTKILGMSAADSAALVSELRKQYLRPEYQLRFQWSTGAVAMWDNRATQHTGIRDYPEEVRRRLKRICIARFR
jgi:alpha-ketoglutarate-dependent taurine dioxygenase